MNQQKLISLIKSSPKECKETLTDFARMSLSRGWNEELYRNFVIPYIKEPNGTHKIKLQKEIMRLL